MKKLVLAGILLMLIATIFVFSNSPTADTTSSIDDTKKHELTKLAQDKFKQEKNKGTDMTNGPCLGPIAIGWVADIAHSPRQAVDDNPQNQCSDYLTGKIKHYIELDQNGNLIQMK